MARFPRLCGLLVASACLAAACSDQSGVSRATKVDKVPGMQSDDGTSFVPPEPDPEKLGPPIELFEWGKPEIVASEGWEPAKQEVRAHNYQRTGSQRFELSLDGELTPSMGSTALEKQTQPTTFLRGIVHVEGAADMGARLWVQVLEVRLRGAGGDPFGLGVAAQRLLRVSRLRVELDATGLPKRATLEIPKEVDKELRPHLPAIFTIASGLARLFVPVPDKAAKGQSWTVREKFVDGGTLVTQSSTYRVSEVDGASVHLDVAIEQAGEWWGHHPHVSFGLEAYQDVELPDLVEPESFEYEGRGHGKLEVDLLEPLAVAAQSGVIRTSRTVVEEKGARQEASLRQEVRLRFGSSEPPGPVN